jgi:hypothetical protein
MDMIKLKVFILYKRTILEFQLNLINNIVNVIKINFEKVLKYIIEKPFKFFLNKKIEKYLIFF